MPSSIYTYPIRLRQAFGLELEYMIVDRDSLNVRPVADELIKAVAGSYQSDAEPDGPEGVLSWSNELTLHLIELKTAKPVKSMERLAQEFQRHVGMINVLLEPMNARLMPGAMHPWMDPHAEVRLWPHEHSPIYESYDRIFSCRGHGWANLQSSHINLPFGDDAEFGRLHAAIRLILPITPGLAAASPVIDGATTGWMDTRLNVYRRNSKRIPSVAGEIIPEPVFTRADYDRAIFQKMYRDIEPFDTDGILQHEFLNSRGCIARFDRGSIEIRTLDVQECPAADMAIAALIWGAVDGLMGERWSSSVDQKTWRVAPLKRILWEVAQEGEAGVIENTEYLRLFGYDGRRATAGELWRHIASQISLPGDEVGEAARVMIEEGTLAKRILDAAGERPSRDRLGEVYHDLCDCLAEGRMFQPARVAGA